MTNRPNRRRWLVVVLGLLAGLVAPVAHHHVAADCDDSILECEAFDVDQIQRFLADPAGNLSYPIPMKARQITAVVDLVDEDPGTLALYDSLVPPPFQPPERAEDRKVFFWFVEVWVPNDLNGLNLRWIESSISIRVRHGVEGGWLHLSEPTNDSGAFDTGRMVGFPKYYAAATLEPTGAGGWLARASIDPKGVVGDNSHDGNQQTVRYQWTPHEGATAGEPLLRWTRIEDPYFSVEPFFEGEEAYRIKWTVKPYLPVGDLGNDSTLATVPGSDQLGNVPPVPPYTGLSEFTVGTVDLAVDPDLDAVHVASNAAYGAEQLADVFPEGTDLGDLIGDADSTTPGTVEHSVPGVFWESEHMLLGTTTKLGEGQEAATCADPDHPGGDWTSYGQDLHNSRSQPAEEAIGPANVSTAQLAWKFGTDMADLPLPPSSELQFNGATQGTPIVADGCVYFGTERGNVYALNADTGQLVWQQNLRARVSTLAHHAAADGRPRIFANVAEYVLTDDGKKIPKPHVTALDAHSGTRLWESRTLEDLPGAEVTGSPVPYSLGGQDLVITGISGWPGDDSASDEWYRPGNTRGSIAVLDQVTGRVLEQTYVIPDEAFCIEEAPREPQNDPDHNPEYHHDPLYDQEPRDVPPRICENPSGEGYFEAGGKSGGGVWTTPAIDLEQRRAYFGTGNPSFQADNSDPARDPNHPHTNALVQLDIDPASDTYGEILAAYQGDRDGAWGFVADWDFGASPNLLTLDDGTQVLAALQKSGTFHAVDAADMSLRWKQALGAFGTFAGNAATAATDGTALFVPSGPAPMAHWSLDVRNGFVNWVHPTAPQGFYGPTTYANGVVYSSDIGVLRAAEATTGAPLMERPVYLDVLGWAWASDSGVAVARNTVYLNAGGYLAAYRLPLDLPAGEVPAPDREPPPSLAGLRPRTDGPAEARCQDFFDGWGLDGTSYANLICENVVAQLDRDPGGTP